MIHTKKKFKDNIFGNLSSLIFKTHHCGIGLGIFTITLLFLSIFAGTNFEERPEVSVAGTVAEMDVVANRDLLVEDVYATNARREIVRMAQPIVFNFDSSSLRDFHSLIINLLSEVNGLNLQAKYEAMDKVEEALTPAIAEEVLVILTRPNVQTYILEELLPQVRAIVQEGIVSDLHSAQVGSSGAIVYDIDSGAETLRPDVGNLPDIQSTLIQFNSTLRREESLDAAEQRAIVLLLSAFMPASLSINRNLTEERAELAAMNVAPVYYTLHRGEIVVRKGDIISQDQQAKLQTIYNSVESLIDWRFSAGLFLLVLFISLGLLISPSGLPGTALRKKDYIFMSCLLALSTLLAKIMYIVSMNAGEISTSISMAYAYPVAGTVGLVALVFAARRYCTMGILLSLFTAMMFDGDFTLFFFHFLGGMLATLLVSRAQTRQDVVWSILPLTIGQIIFWLSTALIMQTPLEFWTEQLMSVVINSILSLLMFFALSPILELSFSYTTRFRLMEFMSLEQPLLQEMMVTMPGTYHHSLVVANMVEAGAKAIGANSLLCKVGALYHDIGKLPYPDYFIENQFGGRNKHDKLAPSMSALILTSHVKRGIELAHKHKLGTEIADIIGQHHGTRVISFFYRKAIDMGENPRESDFCYVGPRPQTKEAAILMLADSVEASSRTLSDPTPARLKSHIDKIIKGIFAEGQLDESALTFCDLHKISEQFLRILTGIFHQRIAYPPSGAKALSKELIKDDAKKERIKHAQAKEKAQSPSTNVHFSAADLAKASDNIEDIEKQSCQKL